MGVDRRLKLLFAAHGLASALAIWCARAWEPVFWGSPRWDVIPIAGLMMAQACLLGSWAAFSRRPGAIRWPVLTLGSGVLILLDRAAMPDDAYPILPPSVALAVAGALYVPRAWGARLHRMGLERGTSPRVAIPPGSSIRGLMLLTLATAVIAAIGRLLPMPDDLLLFLAPWVLAFAIVGLAAPWAALGRGPHCPSRSLLVLALAPAILALYAAIGILYGIRVLPSSTTIIIFIAAIGALQAAVLLGSLLVVRSCGYRLAARPSPSADAGPVDTLPVGP